MNKKSGMLYNKIVNLPYEKNRQNFENKFIEILEEKSLQENDIIYLKKYYIFFNKKTPIQEIITFIDQREYDINMKLIEEQHYKLSTSENKSLNKVNLIIYLNDKISTYILDKIKCLLQQSLNYSVEKTEENNKW